MCYAARMLLFILIIFVLLLFYLPAFWAQAVLRHYGQAREDFPGTGGELARHLLDRRGLQHVPVEVTEAGDHYDPQAKAVRLSLAHFEGRSLTAVTVAAHEVGHALQHHEGYTPLLVRTRLVFAAQRAEKVGAWLMMLMPVMALLSRSPLGAGMMLLAGALSFGVAALVHLVTLPVELDASYRRALPMLTRGYIPPRDYRAARRILTACALTYVATALASTLNLWRWLAIIRR